MKMKRTTNCAVFTILLLTIAITGGCHQISELEEDKSVGVNGGFEIVSKGLPVNWLMYTPNTVPNAEFQIALDTNVFREGRQSLRFDVERCAERGGGWHSPGFTNEFFDEGKGRYGEGRYKLSCWVRNLGATYCIEAGGVSAMQGDMRALVKTNERSDEWKQLEYIVDVPKDRWLRLQLNILAPGTFWIDDLRIERIDGDME